MFRRVTTLLFAVLMSGWAQTAQAQVAISLGAEEIYDDNIYLENDTGLPPAALADETPGDDLQPATPSVRSDGDPNDDMISLVSLGLSGSTPSWRYVNLGSEIKGSGFFFADQSDENRFALDSDLKLDARETLIPAPFFVTLLSDMKSESQDVTVAEGSAARQSQTHEGVLSLGVNKVAIAEQTDWSLGYQLVRHDFLGEWLFGGSDSEDDESDLFEEEGADYFVHKVDTGLGYHQTENLEFTFGIGVANYNFTDVETNDLEEKDTDELDRNDLNTELGVFYVMTKEWQAGLKVGADLSRFQNEPEEEEVTVILPDGTESTVLKSRDRDTNSLSFSGLIDYMPEGTDSQLGLEVSQSAATDIDGDRLTTRSVTLNGTKTFAERWTILAAGRFFQYDSGENLSDATDRYEATASLRYNITEAIALSVGWNYAKQNASDNEEQDFYFRSYDYEVNRAFITLDVGLVGTKS